MHSGHILPAFRGLHFLWQWLRIHLHFVLLHYMKWVKP